MVRMSHPDRAVATSAAAAQQPRSVLDPPSRTARRVAVGAVLGALIALVAAMLLGGLSPGSLLVSSGGLAASSTPAPLRAPVHSCLIWNQNDASDARLISCGQPHLFEVTAMANLSDLGTRAPFPDQAHWQQLVTSRCTDRTNQALAGRFDPFGRFTVGAIKPSRDSWGQGDRTLRCGVQATGRTGALFTTTGSILQQDQSDVHLPGTCLGNDSKAVGDPSDCARPHAVEIVGVVDLKNAFPHGYPDEAHQDKVLEAECTRLAADYAGGPNAVADKKLTLFWESLRPESWQAGSTRVDCRLGAFLPDRSGFAPVTGSIKGPVQVGTEPAPPAPPNPGPARTDVPPVTQVDLPGPPG